MLIRYIYAYIYPDAPACAARWTFLLRYSCIPSILGGKITVQVLSRCAWEHAPKDCQRASARLLFCLFFG